MLMRLLYIATLTIQGIRFGLVRTISCNALEIEWFPGFEPGATTEEVMPATWRAIPKDIGEDE